MLLREHDRGVELGGEESSTEVRRTRAIWKCSDKEPL
jgi:hypothetical protein